MPLARDTFWDRGTSIGASTLDPTAYHDPSEEILPASHTTVAAALPPAIWGARGTIVRGSTLGGAPLGWDPNGVSMRVNVDPDIPGQGFVIDPTRISEAMAAAAVADANVRGAQTVEDLRFRASNAMQAFAISNKPDLVPTSTNQRLSPISMPGVYVVPESTLGGAQVRPQQQAPVAQLQGVQTKHAEIPNSMTKLLPGFGPDAPIQMGPSVPVQQPLDPIHAPQPTAPAAQKQASLFASMTSPSQAQRAPKATAAPAGAPTYKVTLEIKDFPTSIEAWYHDVVRNEQVLALVYDTRIVGYPRTRLRPQPEDIAIHVEGAAAFYICTDPGISFVYDGNEYTVFLIKGEHPYKAEPEPQHPGLL